MWICNKNFTSWRTICILLIDDFSRICWIGLLKHKDEEFNKFKFLKVIVENELDLKIKCFRSGQGGEYI